jgi:hypothetical protein
MSRIAFATLALSALLAGAASATDALSVRGNDQDMTGGTVTAGEVVAGANGWLVVHRIAPDGKPGPVIGHAPLKQGRNVDVAAILTEPVAEGERIMLMLHGEDGGMKTGVFEYSLGAKEDGPVRVDGALVTSVIRAQ